MLSVTLCSFAYHLQQILAPAFSFSERFHKVIGCQSPINDMSLSNGIGMSKFLLFAIIGLATASGCAAPQQNVKWGPPTTSASDRIPTPSQTLDELQQQLISQPDNRDAQPSWYTSAPGRACRPFS